MLRSSELKVGDRVELEITGVVGRYNAEVVGFDKCLSPCPLLKVEGCPMLLKHHDYILKRRLEQ